MPRPQRHDGIYIDLRAKIVDGSFPPGSALQTFTQLSQTYGVSVATINKAIAKLKAEGLVRAVRSSGVFVSDNVKGANGRGALGVVLPELGSSVYLEMTSGISKAAEEAGYQIQLCNSGYSASKERTLLESLMQNPKVKGLLVSPQSGPKSNQKFFSWLKGMNYPFAFIDRYIPGIEAPRASCDSVSGAREAVGKLVSLGHRRIAFLSAEDALSQQWCVDRLEGYKKALAEAGIKYDPALVDDKVEAEDVKALLQRRDPPTALFLASNRHIHQALEGIELGRGRGHRVDVAGFDESDASIGSLSKADIRRFMETPLIKVIQPFEKMGSEAVRLLLSSMNGKGLHEAALLKPELVVKTS